MRKIPYVQTNVFVDDRLPFVETNYPLIGI